MRLGEREVGDRADHGLHWRMAGEACILVTTPSQPEQTRKTDGMRTLVQPVQIRPGASGVVWAAGSIPPATSIWLATKTNRTASLSTALSPIQSHRPEPAAHTGHYPHPHEDPLVDGWQQVLVFNTDASLQQHTNLQPLCPGARRKYLGEGADNLPPRHKQQTPSVHTKSKLVDIMCSAVQLT